MKCGTASKDLKREEGRSFRGHGEKNFAIIFLQYGSNIVSSKANNNNEWALAMLEGTHYCLSYVCVPWVYDTVPSVIVIG